MQNTRLETRGSFWGGLARLVEGPVAWLVTLVLIPALLIAVLLLPPVSLMDRLQALTYTRITPAGGMVSDPDGTTASFPTEGVNATFWPRSAARPVPSSSKDKPGERSTMPQPICPIT